MTHLIEWNSIKIHCKVASTLAAEGNAASLAYDRAVWARAICFELEKPREGHWEEKCSQVPFCLGTDCKYLYAISMKPSSTTKEKTCCARLA